MLTIRHYRPAQTPPLPEYVRCDGDCDWDSDADTYDEDGLDCSDYSPQGSYPLSAWEAQMLCAIIDGLDFEGE